MSTGPRPSTWRPRAILCAASIIVGLGGACAAREGPLVLAAASTADVLTEAGARFTALTGVPVRFSFDGTSRLAAQIAHGAPFDLFVSADAAWLDEVAAAGHLDMGSRVDVFGNRLVVVVPAASPPRDDGLLVLGAPTTTRVAVAGAMVPAGRYAREALAHVGLDGVVAEKLVDADHVRTALAWVARGEAQAGIVYASDAAARDDVRVVATFAPDAHRPIVYPAALAARGAHRGEARAFLELLACGEGRAIALARGFMVPEVPSCPIR